MGLTLKQWHEVTNYVVGDEAWQKNTPTGTMYDLCSNYVVPWSVGLGCGVALLLNPEPLAPELMVSHCWAESVSELCEALTNCADEYSLEEHTRIWFCVYSNYQSRALADARGIQDQGPTVAEQLALDPFGAVIGSVGAMITAHTTKADLYGRLWCVFEVDAALQARGMRVLPAFSDDYRSNTIVVFDWAKAAGMSSEQALTAAGMCVETLTAKCSKMEDAQMIWDRILARQGGFDRLNISILWFRASVMAKAGAQLATEVSNAVLDKFEFPPEVVDPQGYDGAGVTVNRRDMALQVLEQPSPERGREAFAQLVAKQAKLNSDLFEAAWHADPAALNQALECGADPFCITKGRFPKTALQVAAKFGSVECCERLVVAGLDPWEKERMTSDGSGRQIETWDAVQYAREHGHAELVLCLEQHTDVRTTECDASE
eukprot:TRINITY_DN38779_c0_g1_i1.p1 TRINITY_DN38779_c0_g1~~TRINITY_DN38779_c0_g1_i1.p1  ORF type:complete len:432 (+),score=80.60 TRINITY_DN38779_c0_g1_i1:201-1496(+)